MDWTSKEEEAMNVVSLNLSILSDERKRELEELFAQHLFPKVEKEWSMELKSSWGIVRWTMLHTITFVTMWNED